MTATSDGPAVDRYVTRLLDAKKRGRVDESARACHEILRQDPEQADALRYMGIMAFRKGEIGRAVAYLERAVAARPAAADFRNDAGAARRAAKDLPAAEEHYRQAIALAPTLAAAYYNLGNLLRDRENREEAIIHYRAAIDRDPEYAAAHNNLGLVLRDLGQEEDAMDAFRSALAVQPLAADPHFNLAIGLKASGDIAGAIDHYRRAVKARPSFASAQSNLGVALIECGEPEAALPHFRAAIATQPDMADAYNNMGNAHYFLGQYDSARKAFDKSLAIEPKNAEVRWNRSLLLLLRGDFENGWREYEWRWRRKSKKRKNYRQPLWNGGGATGKTILLHCEQGFGDAIQFVRYASHAAERGARVLVACPPPLVRLFSAARDVDEAISSTVTPPPFDYHAPLMSLPAILKTTAKTIPRSVPYLKLPPSTRSNGDPPTHVGHPRKGKQGIRVGIVWAGRPTHRDDRNRSCTLAHFRPLSEIYGVDLFSLQTGPRGAESATVSWPLSDLSTRIGDFADTAEQIGLLDLVISVDTAVAHLAGALGRPVWLLLPFAPDFRWMLDRAESPWYPTMRLFRQSQRGDWPSVFSHVARNLEQSLRERPKD